MMQDVVASISTVMTGLVLGLSLVVVVLLGLSAWQLTQDRSRALLGVVAMTLVVIATGSSLVLLSQKSHPWTRLLLALAAPLLVVSRTACPFHHLPQLLLPTERLDTICSSFF